MFGVELFLLGMVACITSYEVGKDVGMSTGKEMILRYDKPNQYDQLPFGTELYVRKAQKDSEKLDGVYDVYKQVSKDHNSPHWEKMREVVNRRQIVDSSIQKDS